MDGSTDMLDRGRVTAPDDRSPEHNRAHDGRRDRPSRAEAEAAVKTLIRWAGDDPKREGLRETPARVARAYEEWFSGYGQDPEILLDRTFDEVGSYAGPVELRDIPLRSFCEHHLAAIQGKVHIAYMPVGRGVGISKLVRVVEVFARRLQIQERLTSNIAAVIDETLRPRGVAVVVEAEHACMTSRGVRSHNTRMVTKCLLGLYDEDAVLRREFLSSIGL